MNQRRGLVCLQDLVQTSAKEVNDETENVESVSSATDPNPEEMETDNDCTLDIETGKPKKKRRSKVSKGARPSKNLKLYARQLQTWDYMLEEDIEMLSEGTFQLFSRPEGSRCLVLSGKGNTVARD